MISSYFTNFPVPDSGILICPVLESTSAGDPFVVVLDARTMAEIARGVVPTRLPMGFHAHYVAPKQ
jgi:carotenoid cleavage dioxygenase-like enzyme